MEVGRQVPAGQLGLGVGTQLADQLPHLGVVGAEDRELEALAGGERRLLQFDQGAGAARRRRGCMGPLGYAPGRRLGRR